MLYFRLRKIKGINAAKPADSETKIKLFVSLIDCKFFLLIIEKIYRGKLNNFEISYSNFFNILRLLLNSITETFEYLSFK